MWRIGTLRSAEVSRDRANWRFLAFIFVFLAVDEFVSIHEYLITPMQAVAEALDLRSGYLYFAWFIPYSAALIVAAAVLIPFFFRLPVRTRGYFLFAGIIFVSGAVGMEMIGGNYWVSQGWSIDMGEDVNLQYAMIVTIEELLEMIGIVLFIQGLADYYFERNPFSLVIHTRSRVARHPG